MSCEITFAGAKLGRRSDWRRPAGGGGREFFDIDRQAGGARNGECHPGQSGQGESRQVKPGPSMTRGHISKTSACTGLYRPVTGFRGEEFFQTCVPLFAAAKLGKGWSQFEVFLFILIRGVAFLFCLDIPPDNRMILN